MQETENEILVWLPSPLGDAVLCTPALRAIRQNFKSSKITFYARPVVCGVLSPCSFNDRWLEQRTNNPFVIAKMLKAHKFTHAILFKNSFSSALAIFLAGVRLRVGYSREGRGFLLTDILDSPKLPDGKFKPISMIDYYLAISSRLGADTSNKKLELSVDQQDQESVKAKLPEVAKSERPVIIIVPGAAAGPSKCWLSERFAQTADWLITNYNVTVVISVAPTSVEEQIAKEICDSSRLSLRPQQNNLKGRLINLAVHPLSLGELKAFFSSADLVITNDTGPRHIAIALQRKIISLLGPNNPDWTDFDYEDEIQIIGEASCAPCDKAICKKSEHLCMQAITVEMVCENAKKLLEKSHLKQR
jgi:heptosyltransferase-2